MDRFLHPRRLFSFPVAVAASPVVPWSPLYHADHTPLLRGEHGCSRPSHSGIIERPVSSVSLELDQVEEEESPLVPIGMCPGVLVLTSFALDR